MTRPPFPFGYATALSFSSSALHFQSVLSLSFSVAPTIISVISLLSWRRSAAPQSHLQPAAGAPNAAAAPSATATAAPAAGQLLQGASLRLCLVFWRRSASMGGVGQESTVSPEAYPQTTDHASLSFSVCCRFGCSRTRFQCLERWRTALLHISSRRSSSGNGIGTVTNFPPGSVVVVVIVVGNGKERRAAAAGIVVVVDLVVVAVIALLSWPLTAILAKGLAQLVDQTQMKLRIIIWRFNSSSCSGRLLLLLINRGCLGGRLPFQCGCGVRAAGRTTARGRHHLLQRTVRTARCVAWKSARTVAALHLHPLVGGGHAQLTVRWWGGEALRLAFGHLAASLLLLSLGGRSKSGGQSRCTVTTRIRTFWRFAGTRVLVNIVIVLHHGHHERHLDHFLLLAFFPLSFRTQNKKK